jgi:hypothetical protein
MARRPLPHSQLRAYLAGHAEPMINGYPVTEFLS